MLSTKEASEFRDIVFVEASKRGFSIHDLKEALQYTERSCDWSVCVPEAPNYQRREKLDEQGNLIRNDRG